MAITLTSARILQWGKEGRIYHATHGALTTPAAFETDLVRQTPDLMVRVPAGVVIVPIFTSVNAEATDTAVQQVLISVCNNDPGTTGKTQFTPVNLNSRYVSQGSAVTAWITSTDNSGTAPTGVSDVYRAYVQPRIDNVGTGSAPFEQALYAPLSGMGAPCVVGSKDVLNAFLVYVGMAGTATGYILSAWAEFTYDEFYAA